MKIFIGYASMSGNTEDIANIINDVLLNNGCEVKLEPLENVKVDELLAYDCVFIGAYTWGDGDLPYDIEDFYEELTKWNSSAIAVACFGSGDYAYPKFCAAVDTLADTFEEKGCKVFDQRLKIELNPETDQQISECRQFAQSAYEWALSIKGVKHV